MPFAVFFLIFADSYHYLFAEFRNEEISISESIPRREDRLFDGRCRCQSGVPDDDDFPVEVLYGCIWTGWCCGWWYPNDR